MEQPPPSVQVAHTHLILENIFKHCDLDVISQALDVCPLWEKLALPRWKREIPMLCYYDQRTHRLKSNEQNDQDDFKHLFEESSTIKVNLDRRGREVQTSVPTVRNLKLKLWKFTEYMLGYTDGIQGLSFEALREKKDKLCDPSDLGSEESGLRKMALIWVNTAQWITHLTLYEVEAHSQRIFKRTIFEMTPCLQSLDVIRPTLTSGTVADPQQQEHNEVAHRNYNLRLLGISLENVLNLCSWKDIFLSFPNLKELALYGDNFPGDEISKLVVAFDEVSNLVQLQITTLSLNCWVRLEQSDGVLERLLSRSELQLDRLHFDICNEDDQHHEDQVDDIRIDCQLLRNAVERFGNNLRELRLSNSYEFPYSRFPCDGPLSNLTKLTLASNAANNLEVLHNTPNLRILEIIASQSNDDEIDIGLGRMLGDQAMNTFVGLVLPQLHQLEINGSKKIVANHYYLRPEHFEAFGTCMPGLTSLSAALSTQSFRVVCRVWSDLRKLVMCANGMTDEGFLPVGNLNELRECTVSEALLTDVSVTFGLMELPYLTKVCVTDSSQISDESFSEFRQLRPYCFVGRTLPSLRCDFAEDDDSA